MSYYKDFGDISLYNWRKCQEKGQFAYCRVGYGKISALRNKRKWFDMLVKIIRLPFFNDEITIYTDESDLKAWDDVYDTYLLEFGLGETYLRMIEMRRQIAIHECDYVINNNNFLLNVIEIMKEELKNLMERPIKGDTDTILASLEKWQGRSINEREISAKRFFKMIDELKAVVSKQKKQRHGKEK